MNLLRLQQVHLAFGDVAILDDVDLQVNVGDRVCLIGRNGAGKSSLIKLLVGEQLPDSGNVWRSPACKIGYLQQDLPDRDDLCVSELWRWVWVRYMTCASAMKSLPWAI